MKSKRMVGILLLVVGLLIAGGSVLGIFLYSSTESPAVTPTLTPTPTSTATSDETPGSNLLVVVNSEIHSLIQPEITQYKADLESEGYTVQVISYNCKTPSQLRETIRNYDPDGVFLIGDFPVAWFEIYPYTMEIEGGIYAYDYHTIFPTDFYYMDLDGIWMDSDGNGYFDKHTGNVEPEVFFGRLTTSQMDALGEEVEITKDYLERAHQYRTGLMEVKDKALIYWCKEYDCGGRDTLREIYESVDIIDFQEMSGGQIDYLGGGKEDFLQKIREGYQFVILGGLGHSGSTEVTMGDDQLYCSDLIDANPRSQFYVLHSCLNSRYTDSGFIAGYFAYSGKGLISIGGSSEGGGIGRGQPFYESLQFGASFGEAMKDFFTVMVSTDAPEQYINYRLATHSYSTILLGDPTLKIIK